MNASRLFKLAAAPVAFVLVAVAAYANVLNSYFLSDDFAQIGKVLAGDFSTTWGQEHGGFFRPLFILSYAAAAALWGREPFGYHLTNAALHGLNSFLVTRLYLSLRDAATPCGHADGKAQPFVVASLAAGLVFLLHPSHTEAVSWISGRADLLATFFGLLMLLCFMRHAHTRAAAPLLASAALFALALLSKESAACLLLVVLAIGLYLARRQRDQGGDSSALTARGALFATVYLASVLAAYVVARYAALGKLIGGYGAAQHLNFTHGVFASQTLRYSLRALLPADVLRAIPFLESKALSPTLIALGAALVLAAVFFLRRREHRRAFASWLGRHSFVWLLLLTFFLCLLPAINLRVNVYDTQGERYLYLASAFSSMALAHALVGAGKASRRSRLRLATLAAVLVFYGASLWLTNSTWREAARVSANVVGDLTNLSTRSSLLVLNAPDNLRGAHLFRNGLKQALMTFQDEKRIDRVEVVGFHAVDSAGDMIELGREGNDAVLRLNNLSATFERVDAPPPCARLLERTSHSLRFDLTDCAREFDVFFYSAGRAHKINGL